MNWSLFYELNKAWVDNIMLGLTYFIMFAIFSLTIKALIKNLKEDEEK
jgi:hypothetical protein